MANTTGKKFGGRQKGTPNKLTKELQSVLKDVLYEEIDRLPERLEELDTKDQLVLLVKLMPFVFPKVQSASQSLDEPLSWQPSDYR
jgi:hypothetical protein